MYNVLLPGRQIAKRYDKFVNSGSSHTNVKGQQRSVCTFSLLVRHVMYMVLLMWLLPITCKVTCKVLTVLSCQKFCFDSIVKFYASLVKLILFTMLRCFVSYIVLHCVVVVLPNAVK